MADEVESLICLTDLCGLGYHISPAFSGRDGRGSCGPGGLQEVRHTGPKAWPSAWPVWRARLYEILLNRATAVVCQHSRDSATRWIKVMFFRHSSATPDVGHHISRLPAVASEEEAHLFPRVETG